MNREMSGLVILLVLSSIGQHATAITYKFTNIADSTMSAPGGTFVGFQGLSIGGGTVAFAATTSNSSGIFTGTGGSLTTIVKSGDPGPVAPFGLVSDPAISGNKVAFHASFGDVLQSSGIFVGSGGPLTTIAFERDPAPVGTFVAFSEPAISGDTVAFRGIFGPSSNRKTGIFTGSGGTLTTITLTNFSAPSISGEFVSFFGRDEDGDEGIFVGAGGPLIEIAKIGGPAPTGTFTGFSRPSISGGNIAFEAETDSGDFGVYRSNGQEVVTIASSGAAAPIGSFYGVGSAAIGGDTVAFSGSYNEIDEFGNITGEGAGIFIGSGGPLTSVIQAGDPLFGSTLTDFYAPHFGAASTFVFDPEGSGNVGFLYSLADGRFGVALATPVPEPTIIGLLGGFALGVVAFARRIQQRSAL